MGALNYFLIILLTCSSVFSNFTRNEKYKTALWSLRCLYEGFEACEHFLTGSDFEEEVRFDNLEKIFSQQSPKVRETFVHHNFTSLSENELCSISTPLLLLIPINQLARLDGEALGKLLVCHSYDLSVVRQIAFAARRSNSSDVFYRFLQSTRLSEPQLRILGQSVIRLNNASSVQIFLSERDSILEFLSPVIIASNPSKMLSYLRNVHAETWSGKPVDIKRIWAFFLVNSEYPTTIVLWDDKTLEKWGHLLIGATGDELQSLQASNIRNKTVFLDQDFSPVQVRYIFDDFYGSSNVSAFSSTSIKRHFYDLLPRQVQRYYAEAVNLKIIDGMETTSSLATARQIVHHFIRAEANTTLDRFLAKDGNILKLKRFSFCLPLNFFARLKTKFPLVELLKVQHGKMTRAQMFYLTNRGSVFDNDANDFPKVTHLLQALPTTFLFNSKASGYNNLLTNLPANVPPRTAALLQVFWSKLVQQNFLRYLVQNPDFSTYLDFLPSKFYAYHSEELINSLLRMSLTSDVADRIPDLGLASLLAKYHKGPITWKIVNSRNGSISQDFLLHGMTCSDIETMDPLDFIFIISKFNVKRKSVGKPFPGNLQLCSIVKLREYLYVKSSFMPLYEGQSLLALLTPADIQSLGGFILAGLPVDDLHKAAHRSLIIRTIGSLTPSELMAAAPMDKLLSITELFVTEGVGLGIFELGNLTHFLSVHSINQLKGPAFKLLLESGLFDKRICATDAQRSAWAYLIISGFGNPEDWTAQDLITLGDMLFVMPYTEMERVSEAAWTEAADIIAASTGYVDEIHWPQPGTPFYQACRVALKDQYEGDHYVRELSLYVGWLLLAAQRQIATVVPAERVASNKDRAMMAVSSSVKQQSTATSRDKSQDGYSSWWRRLYTVMGKRRKRDTQFNFELSCDAIRMVGKSTELFLNVGLLEKMKDIELAHCLNEFAQMDMSDELSSHIWRRIVTKEIVLIGKLAAAVEPKDLVAMNVTNFDMTSPWGLELVSTLGRYNSRNDTATYLLDKLENVNDHEVTFEQLVALGPLSCQLSKIKTMMTATVFLKASRYLSSVLPCDRDCLDTFSHLIDHENSYGPIANWTSEDIESMGIFVSALNDEKWSVLIKNNSRSLSRLGINALRCLDRRRIEVMTSEVMSVLPLNTAQNLMEFRSMHLNDTVRVTLLQRLSPQYEFSTRAPSAFESSSSVSKPRQVCLLYVIITLYFYPILSLIH